MIKIPNTPSIYDVFNCASMICVFITVTVHGYTLVDSDRVLNEQEGHSADTV